MINRKFIFYYYTPYATHATPQRCNINTSQLLYFEQAERHILNLDITWIIRLR